MTDHIEDACGITALLGPTNTGKTHRALERMLEHASGMIGLPLRLLAREVYDRLTTKVGERAVALVTGEEKRVPANPVYWVCTVEAMPMDLQVDFVAIDEIQLSAHPERGHVFTDRLLNARGRKETWFLGSETIRHLIERLVPTARIRKHPRLSRLRGIAPVSINALPKRSAVVAFSAQRVYELGERIRRKHGGAALVLGALSPRTRNAQVALYQSGEVDYLVATDAIGMGLNLDIANVIFADAAKFDGREHRPLELPELAQIAGRAGRYLNDGNFGVLAPNPPFSPKVLAALEHHRFSPEQRLYFRNSDLDMTSLDTLVASLASPPHRHELRPIAPAEDHRALLALANKPEIRRLANSPERVALLWEVCQIPDYRQLLFELHLRLLEESYLQLTAPEARLESKWIDEQVRRIDHVEGDIETLMGRIASIRTWNYVAQRKSWLERGPELALRARDIEDRLSDALHQALLVRFVERRKTHAHFAPAPKIGNKAHPFAQLLLLHSESRAAAASPVAGEQSVDELVEANHEEFSMDALGRILYRERTVGNLSSGVDLLHPEVKVRLEPDPGKGAHARVQRRLTAFTRDSIANLLQPLRARTKEQFSGAARGLAYQLEQGLGTVAAESCREQLSELTPRDRQLFASLGLRFGRTHLYFRKLLGTEQLRQRFALAGAYFPGHDLPLEELLVRRSWVDGGRPNTPAFASAIGFVLQGPLWLRVDIHDRLTMELLGHSRTGDFLPPKDLAARLECDERHLPELLMSFGYTRRPRGRFSLGSPRRRRDGMAAHRDHRTPAALTTSESEDGRPK